MYHFDLIHIGENDKAIFYTNSFCLDGEDYKMLVAELKPDLSKEYILIDKKSGNIVYANPSAEAVYYRIDALRLSQTLE